MKWEEIKKVQERHINEMKNLFRDEFQIPKHHNSSLSGAMYHFTRIKNKKNNEVISLIAQSWN